MRSEEIKTSRFVLMLILSMVLSCSLLWPLVLADQGRSAESFSNRWDFAFRVKRGFEDTSLPGSFCKDQMYLGGALTILQHKDTIDFSALYMGQIALEDLHRLRPGANVDNIELPSFVLDVEGYHDKLSAVILDNDIDLSLCQDASAGEKASGGINLFDY